MMGVGKSARAMCWGLAAVALTACASAPEPVRPGAWGRGASVADLPRPPRGEPRVTDPSAGLQCVPFARSASGVEIYGDAYTWWRQAAGRYPRSNTPAAGSVMAIRGFNNPGRGHVAVVSRIDSDRIMRIDHANWLNGGEISRDVPVLDVSPNNDWTEIRVWHIPGGHWGGRVYRADGFIHPIGLRLALS